MSKVIPSVDEVKQRGYERFGWLPCLWQIEIARVLLERRDLVGTAATGAGKSVTFFLPAFFEKGGVTVLVCPLKGLGDQHAADVMKYGFVAISLTAETITTDVINASDISLSSSLTS